MEASTVQYMNVHIHHVYTLCIYYTLEKLFTGGGGGVNLCAFHNTREVWQHAYIMYITCIHKCL